eukprot:scaffold1803_cov92-Amphora_coffeaeformis.AAC.60
MGRFENALQRSPVEDLLDFVIGILQELLQEDEPDVQAIRDCLSLIQGSNKSHYKRPSREILANGAKPVVGRMLESPEEDGVLLENVTLRSLRAHHGDWLRTKVDLDNAVWCHKLSFTPTFNNSIMVSVPSVFMIYSPDTHVKTRISLMEQYLLLQEIFIASDLYSAKEMQQVLRLRGILQADLMRFIGLRKPNGVDDEDDNDNDNDNVDVDMAMDVVKDLEEEEEDLHDADILNGIKDIDTSQEVQDGEDDSDDSDVSEGTFTLARSLLFSSELFKGSNAHVPCVTKVAGLNTVCALYMFEKMKAVMFQKLMVVAFGVQGETTPMDPAWTCQIRHACKSLHSTNPKDKVPVFVEAFTGQGNPYYGNFCCKACHRGIAGWERTQLSAKDTAELTAQETQRLVTLEQSAENHRQIDRDRRAYAIAQQGQTQIQSQERQKEQASRERLAFAPDANAQANRKNQYMRDSSQRQVAEGKTKASGTSRRKKGNVGYPQWFQNVMAESLRKYAAISQSNIIYNNARIDLFDALVIKEKRQLDFKFTQMYTRTQPYYYPYGYDQVTNRVLEKTRPRAKTWKIKGATRPATQDASAISGLKMTEIIPQVMAELYPPRRVTYCPDVPRGGSGSDSSGDDGGDGRCGDDDDDNGDNSSASA